jgi:hypothetical protein
MCERFERQDEIYGGAVELTLVLVRLEDSHVFSWECEAGGLCFGHSNRVLRLEVYVHLYSMRETL